MKKVITGTLTACAMAGIAFATTPASAATTPVGAGSHAYNQTAPRGSLDNPIILRGGSPLLTTTQQQALDQYKEQLAAGTLKAAPAGQTSARTDSAAVQPNVLNNCNESGFYYCNGVNTTIGSIKMGTLLDSNHHENAEAEGLGRGSNNWAVYMDQSRDGGKTWTPELEYVVNTTEWSNSIFDGPGYYDRACLVDNQHGLYYCLPWH